MSSIKELIFVAIVTPLWGCAGVLNTSGSAPFYLPIPSAFFRTDAMEERPIEKATIEMPELVGKAVDAARQFLAREGFTRVRYEDVGRPGCAAGMVCATTVKAGQRVWPAQDLLVYVGAKVPPADQVALESAYPPRLSAQDGQKKPDPVKPRPADFF